jgi:NAD(P) transhydrogenase subunit alpha
MRIAVLKERAAGENRVAVIPETVKKFSALGAVVAVESGAGAGARVSDEAYREAGAEVGSAETVLKGADIVLAVQAPDPTLLKPASKGAWVAATFDPFGSRDRVEAYAKAGLEALAMEFMPRITRAHVMDVLSSHANLAG